MRLRAAMTTRQSRKLHVAEKKKLLLKTPLVLHVLARFQSVPSLSRLFAEYRTLRRVKALHREKEIRQDRRITDDKFKLVTNGPQVLIRAAMLKCCCF